MKVFCFFLILSSYAQSATIVVGSKKFTESVILGEILRLGLEVSGKKVTHKRELGGTTLLWNALKSGDIDLYPEYTGTIQEEILRSKTMTIDEMRATLAPFGVGITGPLGFSNTYAIGMLETRAQQLGIDSISQLRQHPSLVFGWASEFMQRKDGWPGLREAYKLRHTSVRGIDHDVGYRALAIGDIDVVDLYSTDAEIPYYKIRPLQDDRSFFPAYEAVILYRLTKETELKNFLEKLEGSITASQMSAMNMKVKIDRNPSPQVAASFLETLFDRSVHVDRVTWKSRVLERTGEHIKLVAISLALAIAAAIPLGIICAKSALLGKISISIVSVIQTVPALALLVLLIKPLGLLGLSGIGDTPALVALFLYSLLPIVRSTHTGIEQIPRSLQETATVLNLSARTRLLRIELPLALPLILSGIKTSLVLNIGFATLGALVGAGGYGQSILSGIRLDDFGLILEGALPAALLALAVQQIFDILERKLVSRGLRT